MKVKEAYEDKLVEVLLMMNPSWKKQEDKLHKIVHRIMEENLLDPTIEMDNNVTGDHATITLTKLCNWMEKENPVISGNATYYCQPEVLEAPTSRMLRALKKGRKLVKKKMFSYQPGSDEYMALDLDQANKKVIMNAEYGGSGTKTAAFYTKYSPAATTLLSQSIITTMAAFFEGYVGNNQKFYHVNECIDWMMTVIQKKTEKIPKWVIRPTAGMVKDRIHEHFIEPAFNDWPTIDRFVDHLNEDRLTYLYYVNNLNQFIRMHPHMQNLIGAILDKLPKMEAAIDKVPPEYAGQFENTNKYNRYVSEEMFLNPYNVPAVIKDELHEFIELTNQFIYLEYITPDSIVKLNNHKRNTVLLVDTDSNMINADMFVSLITHEIFPGQTFGRVPMYNDMILVNVLAAVLDPCIAGILDYYGRCHHMGPEARAELTMKNEFMFRTFFLMQTKKRYAASIVLREGNIIYPFKEEIKGMDFIKAGISSEVEKRFTKMLCDYILFADELDLHGLMTDLKAFEREIYQNTKKGDTKYLKQSQYKPLESYKSVINANGEKVSSGWSNQVFRGSFIWNELYPEQKINILDQVKIIKLNVTSPSDLDVIKDDFPEMYNKVMALIFINASPELKKNGLRNICIPANIQIPEWIRPLINYDALISDMISSFRSVLDALHLQEFNYKTSTGKATTTSCLISL